MAGFLKAAVQLMLDIFPDGVAIRAVDKHTLDRSIINQLRLGAHVGVPLRKVLVHIRDGLHLSLIFRHNSHSSHIY